MKKLILAFVLGGALGAAAGFGGGIFVYPFWFPPPAGMDQVADIDRQTVVAAGHFVHADPNDPVHYGKGGVTIYRAPDGAELVHLEKDFEVGPGPRFHVYLVDNAMVRSGSDFRSSAMVDLGSLRSFKGSQNYAVPRAVSAASYKSVVIWCKEFGVLITPATLAAAPDKAKAGETS